MLTLESKVGVRIKGRKEVGGVHPKAAVNTHLPRQVHIPKYPGRCDVRRQLWKAPTVLGTHPPGGLHGDGDEATVSHMMSSPQPWSRQEEH